MAVPPTNPRSSGFWAVVIAGTLVVLAALWWFTTSDDAADGEGRDLVPAAATPLPGGNTGQAGTGDGALAPVEPQPAPGSPAAMGTAGEPAGTTGSTPQPGDPTSSTGN